MKKQKCMPCRGKGRIRKPNWPLGSKSFNEVICSNCGGSGKV